MYNALLFELYKSFPIPSQVLAYEVPQMRSPKRGTLFNRPVWFSYDCLASRAKNVSSSMFGLQ